MNISKYETVNKIVSPEADLEEYLNKKVTNEFFPDTGRWYMSCFKQPKELSVDYLPCHLDDNKWLTDMLLEFCNLPQEKYKEVLNYVKTSDVFYNAKKEYGLKIVEWQIDFIKNDGEGYVLKDQHGGDFWKISKDCDKSFRWAVIDTLEAIGMNINLIEEGLEKYSSNWRDTYIILAFRNQYEPIIINFIGFEEGKEYPDINEDFKTAWIAMRKYEYYKEHREIVDLYGTAEPEMKISFKEAEELKQFVDSEAAKRIAEIKNVDAMYHHKTEINEEQSNNTSLSKKKKFLTKFKK